jgi:phosphomannomutase
MLSQNHLFGTKQAGKVLISNDGRESSSAIEKALSLGIKHQGSDGIISLDYTRRLP